MILTHLQSLGALLYMRCLELITYTIFISLMCAHPLFASPLGPEPARSFEGKIDYQANAETLLRCDQQSVTRVLGRVDMPVAH